MASDARVINSGYAIAVYILVCAILSLIVAPSCR
jgi:hypothetical protein